MRRSCLKREIHRKEKRRGGHIQSLVFLAATSLFLCRAFFYFSKPCGRMMPRRRAVSVWIAESSDAVRACGEPSCIDTLLTSLSSCPYRIEPGGTTVQSLNLRPKAPTCTRRVQAGLLVFVFVRVVRNEIGIPIHGGFRYRIDLAGLLTRSCPEAFPTLHGPVAEMFGTSRSFTAAGLSGICTRFPFHSPSGGRKDGNQI